LNFRLSFYDFPWDVGTAADIASPRRGFGAVLEALQEPGASPGPFRFMPSLEFSRDLSRELPRESTSKDSRKLFNPRLFSQTRTDVSVQFSRNRRRPAAGGRMFAERFIGVKRKKRRTLRFSNFSRFFPLSQPKELAPHRHAGH